MKVRVRKGKHDTSTTSSSSGASPLRLAASPGRHKPSSSKKPSGSSGKIKRRVATPSKTPSKTPTKTPSKATSKPRTTAASATCKCLFVVVVPFCSLTLICCCRVCICLAVAEQEQELASLRAQLTHVSDELVIVEAACGSKAKDRHTLAQITSLEMTR